MASDADGFPVSDGDRERLDRRVEYVGGGNRPADPWATRTVVESLRRAERLRELQATNSGRLVERGVSAEDLPGLIGEACKASTS